MPGHTSKIIVVEAQPVRLRELESQLRLQHVVIGTMQFDRALPLLRGEPEVTTIIVSTSTGGDVLGVLEAAMRERPEVLRVLVTGFEDLTMIVEGLHSGAVQRVISRPLQHGDLRGMIRPRGDETFISRQA